MLCARCENFDIQAFRSDIFPYRGFPLSAVVHSAVVHSAHDRCSFCSLILNHLRLVDSRTSLYCERKNQQTAGFLSWLARQIARPPWVQIGLETNKTTNDPEGGGSGIDQDGGIVKMNIFVAFRRPGLTSLEEIQTFSVQMNVAADPGTAATRDITGKLVVQDAQALDIAKPIQAWHDQCCNTHEGCNQTLSRCEVINANYAPLPSRCIKVKYVTSLKDYSFQLYDTAGQFGRYVILSHRWVPETFACRTTHANYPQRAGIDSAWDQKPTRLFIETCMLAHHLDIPFVGIDSLCIIQDDTQDWEREAVKMAGYYQHAWVTISATMTSPATGGLLNAITAANLPRVSRLPYRDRQGVRSGYFYVQCTEQAELNRLYQQYVEHSELLTGGWVYQEWLLSPRTVAFSPVGVIMVCSASPPQSAAGDLIHNERTMQEQQPDSTRPERGRYLINIAFKPSIIRDMCSLDAVFESWYHVVATYSGLAFTQLEADRLVGLAGVASEFGQALGKHMHKWNDNVSQVDDDRVPLTVVTRA